MPIVEVNGQEYEFPDTMGREEIRTIMAKKFPQENKAPVTWGDRWQAIQTGITKLPLGLLQAESEGASWLAEKAGYPETAANLQNTANIFGQVATEQENKGQEVVKKNPYLEALAVAPQVGQVVGGGTSTPALLLSGFTMGALQPQMNQEQLVEPANTKFDQLMQAFGYLPNKAVELAGLQDTRLGGGLVGAGTAGTGVLAAKGIRAAAKTNLAKDIKSGTPKIEAMTADDFRSAASQSYKTAAEKGANIAPTYTDKFINTIEENKPKPIAGKVLTAEDNLLLKELDDYAPLQGASLTLDDIQRIDQSLNNKIQKYVDPKTGKMDNTGRVLYNLKQKFSDMVENATESDLIGGKAGIDSWKQGKDYWFRASKLDEIESVLEKAKYSDNPRTIIKNGIKNIVTNKNKLKGLTKSEINALQKAAKTGVLARGLSLAGSGLVTIGTLVAGGGLPGAAMAYAGSRLAGTAAEALQKAKVNKAIQAITNTAR